MAAAVNKTGKNSVPSVVAMLRQLGHRGSDVYGVATPTSVTIAHSIDELQIEGVSSSVAVGHNLLRADWRDRPQPVMGKGYAFVFEGRLFPPPTKCDVEAVMEKIGSNPWRDSAKIIKELNGSYVFVIASLDRLIVGRDTVGTNPLYYGRDEKLFAVASERKALWKLGIEEARSFPPGNLAAVTSQGITLQPVNLIVQPPRESVSMKKAAEHLQTLLLKSTKDRLTDVEKVAVAFSGGLDSSLIAVLAKMCNADVHLISVGLESSPELERAKNTAAALEQPLSIQTYTVNDVESALPKVLWLVEEPNPLKSSIAIPFFWTAETASKLGFRVLLAGQGADELFGGYRKYLLKYAKFSAEALEKEMYRDVALSYETNFQRDNSVCAFHGVELRLPYADRAVVCFGLSLPPKLKIWSVDDDLRKRVLRGVARNLGLPLLVVNRRKKAVQYATGVDRALRQLARRESLTLVEYIRQVFRKVYPDVRAKQ